jgi:hypothetical protein
MSEGGIAGKRAIPGGEELLLMKDYFYDICGLGMHIRSPLPLENVLPPLYRRDGLTAAIEVTLVAGIDRISVAGAQWYQDAAHFRAYRPDGGRALYEHIEPLSERLFYRMECSPNYAAATIAYAEEGLDDPYGLNLRGLLRTIYQRYLLVRGGLMIHAVSVLDGGQALLFSGPSGMGKSTQAALWQTHCDVIAVNGDNADLLFREGVLYTTGSPWSGSSRIYTELAAPVRAVVFLEQAKEDAIIPLTGAAVLPYLLPRAFVPHYSRELMERAVHNMEHIIQSTRFFLLRNTATAESVRVLQEALRLDQAKILRTVNEAREEAAERGFLSSEEIDAEIRAYRREKRGTGQ